MTDNDKSKPCSIEKVEVLLQGLERVQNERWEGHRREHEMLAQALATEKQFVTDKMEGLNEVRRQVIEDRAQFVSKSVFESVREEKDRRLNTLENSKLSVTDGEKIERDVGELHRIGCSQARQAIARLGEIEINFTKLQLESASRGAVEDNRQELLRYRSRQSWLIIGNVIALLGVAMAALFGILAYLQGRH